jgi:phage tail tape-measure protein
MRGLKIIVGSLALALAFPGLAAAQEGIATGAVTGAITGGLVGGPIGAVIGGVAGAALGDAAAVTSQSEPLVVQNPVTAPVMIQRTCVRDAAGNQTCREIIR